jgi:F-type H+-transporting ATPase subunit beta
MTGKPIGVIKEVHGPVVKVSCDALPPLHQALETRTSEDYYLLEVYQHIDEEHIRAIALHRATGLKRGLPVHDTGAPIHVPVTPSCLGRLLNVFGEPLDDGASLAAEEFRNILGRPIPLYESSAQREVLETGIKVIDLICPFIRGGKAGLFGGAGVGKTVLIMEFMHSIATLRRGASVLYRLAAKFPGYWEGCQPQWAISRPS